MVPGSDILQILYPAEHLETLEPGVLTVACTGEHPTDWVEDGQLTGLHGEVRRWVAEMLRLKINPVQMEWPSIIPAVSAKRVDMPGLGTAWTAERARAFTFTQPYQYFFLGAVQRAGAGIQSFDDLSGKRMSTIEPCFNIPELHALVGSENVYPHPTARLVLEDVISGRADVGLDDLPRLEYALANEARRSEFEVLPFRFDPKHPLTTSRFPVYFMFHRDAVNLRAAADLAIDALKTSGTLQRIYESYGFSDLLSILPTSRSKS